MSGFAHRQRWVDRRTHPRKGPASSGPGAALLVALCAASAASSEPLRLGQALELARAGPSLRAASVEVDVARAHLVQAGLPAANPVLTGELSRHTDSSDAYLDRGILISQEVEIGGQRGLRVSAARHDVERAEHQLAERRRTLDAGVRRAFAELVDAAERRELAVDSVALARRILEIAERRARAGDAGELEVRLVRIEMLRAEQVLAGAETDRTRAASALASAVGAGPEAGFEAVPEEAGPVPSLDEEALVAWALSERPDLASARAEREQLEGEARAIHRGGLIRAPMALVIVGGLVSSTWLNLFVVPLWYARAGRARKAG